ncbi:MAG: alanine racemase [Armatimonadetes bacterium]|nr:alanine racemase [Armatimonadota bacterium]
MRPAWLEIDLNAITENVRRIRRHVGPRTSALAVVKANAYGHGLLPCAMAALRGGASHLGVAILDEALELRENGVTAPVLILGAPLPECASEIMAAGVSQVVSCAEAITALSDVAAAQGREIGLHLKVDTGMCRVGANPAEAVALAQRILEAPGVRLEGICTHFATSDEDPDFLAEQNAGFQRVLEELDERGFTPPFRHAANSGAIQASRETRFNLVRAGLLTYGCPPLPDEKPELIPALQWKTRLVQVKRVPAGSFVGYGITARLSRDSILGVVPLGYADGWPRALSNRGRVLVRGEGVPVVGRVSMDQFTVDLTEIPGASLGDEVMLVGSQGERRQTVDDVAAAAATNTHDILAGLSIRLPRVYHS